MGCGRFADRRYADTDILADNLAIDGEDVGDDVGIVECGLYAIVCVGETSVLASDHCPILQLRYRHEAC